MGIASLQIGEIRVDRIVDWDGPFLTALQMFPEWSPRVDWDRARAAQTRRRFLERHADTDTVVMTTHFPQPSTGQVLSAGDAFRFRYTAS